MSRKARIWVGLFAVAAVALAIDRHNVRRIHDGNMLKAEQFKRDFDQHLPPGASLNAVQDYLHSQPVIARPEINRDNFVRELRVEVVSERSPSWECWRTSVGVIAKFTEERLQDTQLASWTFDCLALPRWSP